MCVRIRPNATLLSPGQDESPQTQASNDIRELLSVVKTIQVSMEVMSQNVIQLKRKPKYSHSRTHGRYLVKINLVSARENNVILLQRVHPLAQVGALAQQEPIANQMDDSVGEQCGHLLTLTLTVLTGHNIHSLS